MSEQADSGVGTTVETGEPTSTTESSWIGSDGKFGDVSTAPEGIKEVLEAKKFGGVDDMVKSYTELEKKISSGFKLPDELNEEQMGTIFNKLGRPEKAEDYKFDLGEGYEGIELPDDLMSSFKQFSHKLGLSQQQAMEALKFELDAGTAMREAEMAASEATLQEVYGKDKETAIDNARKAASELGLADIIVSKGLDRDADVVKALNEVAKKIGEDGLKTSTQNSQTSQDRIKEIEADKAFINRADPRHSELHNEWLRLRGIGG